MPCEVSSFLLLVFRMILEWYATGLTLPWLLSFITASVNMGSPYLIVHLPLKLYDFILHANVQLLQVLHRSRLDLHLLELPTGLQAPVRALNHHRRVPGPQELLPLHPATCRLLDDRGFVVQPKL